MRKGQKSGGGGGGTSIAASYRILGQREYLPFTFPHPGLSRSERTRGRRAYVTAPVFGYLPKRPGWDWRETTSENGIVTSDSYTLLTRSKALFNARKKLATESQFKSLHDTMYSVQARQ